MSHFKILCFIVGFFVLDLCVGFMLGPYYRAVTLPVYENFYSRYVNGDGGDFDIVFMGDSRAQHGVDSAYISQQCRCRAGNIAVSGSTMVSMYYLLEDYLEHHQPKLVVVEASWMRLGDQSDGNHYPLLLERLGYFEQLEYALVSRDLGFMAQRLSRSYRYRDALPRFLRRDKSSDFGSRPDQGGRGDEFAPLDSQFDLMGDIHLDLFRKIHPFDLPPDQTQIVYLRKILSLSKVKGIPILLFQPPEPIESLKSVEHFDVLNRAIVNEALAHSVPYIDFADPGDPFLKNKGYFSDLMHLNRIGAGVFTKKLWSHMQPVYSDL